MRVADSIWERLKQETDTVYMVPGGAAMFLVDALGRSGLRYVSAIHEEGAGLMAIGHAMAVNGLGVCLVTAGPGTTNAITACAAAWTESVPLLMISGQAKSETLVGDTGLRTRGVQEIDIIPMIAPITKFALQPLKDWVCMDALETMIVACKSGRPGPCWLSIPQDVQGMEMEKQ